MLFRIRIEHGSWKNRLFSNRCNHSYSCSKLHLESSPYQAEWKWNVGENEPTGNTCFEWDSSLMASGNQMKLNREVERSNLSKSAILLLCIYFCEILWENVQIWNKYFDIFRRFSKKLLQKLTILSRFSFTAALTFSPCHAGLSCSFRFKSGEWWNW